MQTWIRPRSDRSFHAEAAHRILRGIRIANHRDAGKIHPVNAGLARIPRPGEAARIDGAVRRTAIDGGSGLRLLRGHSLIKQWQQYQQSCRG